LIGKREEDEKAKKDIIIIDAIKSIPVNDRTVVLELHNRAINAGYIAFGSKSTKKPDFYKIEYKKNKKDDPLFILHVNGINMEHSL
jgi:hypothetical protein